MNFIEKQTIERSGTQARLNAYALTVVFKNKRAYENRNSLTGIKSINSQFRQNYLELCYFQFGKHLYRRLKDQTQIHSFIDVAGTRNGQKFTEHLSDNPHIHAVVIPHLSQADFWSQEANFENVREIFETGNSVQSVELKPFDDLDGLKRFTGYAAKFYVPNANKSYSDLLYCIYPDITKKRNY